MPQIQLTNDELAIQNAILSDALELRDGQMLQYGGDFFILRSGIQLGVAISTGEEYKDIHNVRPGRCFLLEGKRNVLGARGNFLVLTADTSTLDLSYQLNQMMFANMMFLFVQTKEGNREELIHDPWAWARKVINTNGNDATEDRPYPYIAELYLVNKLCQAGLMTDVVSQYRGPDAGTHDFELPNMSLEVKSHKQADLDDKPGQITVSSEHQLEKTGNKPLFLVYFKIQEEGDLSLRRCVEEFGEHRQILLDKLKKPPLHFVEGDFAWNAAYTLLEEPKVYAVQDDFPRITPSQFPNGHYPSGIVKLMYHVSLHNQPYCLLSTFINALQAGQTPAFTL